MLENGGDNTKYIQLRDSVGSKAKKNSCLKKSLTRGFKTKVTCQIKKPVLSSTTIFEN